MSMSDTFAGTPKVRGRFRLPDPPECPEDKMTNFDNLTINGNAHYLALHLGSRQTTLVAGDRYLVVRPTRNLAGSRYPDLLVAFGVDPGLYKESNGYIIAEQGKPPDFVLEVASESTGAVDVGAKREDYAALGIPEYWRFDQTETGRYHGARLAGDRLLEGEYVPIPTDELPDGNLQGYSAALDLYLRWESGRLVFYDPATGKRVLTYKDQLARANAAEARADAAEAQRDSEREARAAAEARADAAEARADTTEAERDSEREARAAAEARVRELEEQLRRRGP